MKKVQTESVAKCISDSLEASLDPILEDMSERRSDALRTKLTRAIKSAAERSIGYAAWRRRNDWFDEECKNALEKKNQEYKELVQRITRTKKETFWNSRKSSL